MKAFTEWCYNVIVLQGGKMKSFLVFIAVFFSMKIFADPLPVKFNTLNEQEKYFAIFNGKQDKSLEWNLLNIPLEQFQNYNTDFRVFVDVQTTNYVYFYLIDDDGNIIRETFFDYLNPRPQDIGPNFLPSIKIAPDELSGNKLFMVLQKPKIIKVFLSSLEDKKYHKYERSKIAMAIFYLGGAFAVCFFVLVFGHIFKYSSFFYYALYLLFVTPTFSDTRSVLYLFILDSHGEVLFNRIPLTYFTCFACLMFTNRFFDIKKFKPKLAKVTTYCACLMLSLGITYYFSLIYGFFIPFASGSFVPAYYIGTIILSIFLAFSMFEHVPYKTWAFVFTWGILFFFILLWIFVLMGGSPYYSWMSGLIYIGFISQSAILIFSIWRFNKKQIQAEVKAKESNKLRQLLRVVCHDSINLLNVPLAQSERMLKRKEEDLGNHYEAWRKVNIATKEQIELLDHIKQIEAYKSGKREAHLESVNLSEIIEKSFLIFETNLNRKDIKLEINIPKDLPPVLAEKVSLTNNVLNNLLSNAIKFSYPHSKITVEGKLVGKNVRLMIRDRGIGIPNELLEKIFSPTEITTRKGTGSEQGTGFGMPLVKATLDSFKAKLKIKTQVERGEEQGSLFIIDFKIADQISVEGRDKLKKGELENLKGLQVLVLDDDESILELVNIWLNKLDASYFLTEDEKLALDELSKNVYDICFVDQNLENGLLGSDILKDMKKLNCHKETKFILMTADPEINKDNISEYGFDTILEKPVTEEKILSVINELNNRDDS